MARALVSTAGPGAASGVIGGATSINTTTSVAKRGGAGRGRRPCGRAAARPGGWTIGGKFLRVTRNPAGVRGDCCHVRREMTAEHCANELSVTIPDFRYAAERH
jgi:hypothetical protein